MAEGDNRNAEPPRQGRRDNFNLQSIIFWALLAYSITSMVGNFSPQSQGNTTAAVHQGKKDSSVTGTSVSRRLAPFAAPADLFDIHVEATDELFEPIDFRDLRFSFDFFSKKKFSKNVSVNLASCAATNCSLDVHVSWKMNDELFNHTTSLVRFYKFKTVEKHHLMGSKKESDRDSKEKSADLAHTGDTVYRAYISPTLTLSPIIDFTTPLPPQFEPFTPVNEELSWYGPAVYVNDFWTIRDHMYEVNTSSAQESFILEVKVEPLSAMKVAFYLQFEEALKSQVDMGFASDDSADETKRIFLDTNPYFLAITALVTVLHLLFEYLAFANDVKFWRGRKNFNGLSLRSVAINCYFQTIIFLYLMDSNETSWTILLPSGLGVLAEYWKLKQCVVITKQEDSSSEVVNDDAGDENGSKAFTMLGYDVRFSDTYDKRTRKYDDTATRWLVYVMIPILIGYSVYSALYKEHKGWYSYLINTQVQFTYLFGFAMMTPQIFINYKLKSVGQLPWRTFVYKALNTVIDDLFAFIIKMPWLHRVACFRDDVVFVILLYQRWVYPVDASRMADDEAPTEEREDGESRNTNQTQTDKLAQEGAKKNQ